MDGVGLSQTDIIVIGGVCSAGVVLLLVLGVSWFYWKKKKKARDEKKKADKDKEMMLYLKSHYGGSSQHPASVFPVPPNESQWKWVPSNNVKLEQTSAFKIFDQPTVHTRGKDRSSAPHHSPNQSPGQKRRSQSPKQSPTPNRLQVPSIHVEQPTSDTIEQTRIDQMAQRYQPDTSPRAFYVAPDIVPPVPEPIDITDDRPFVTPVLVPTNIPVAPPPPPVVSAKATSDRVIAPPPFVDIGTPAPPPAHGIPKAPPPPPITSTSSSKLSPKPQPKKPSPKPSPAPAKKVPKLYTKTPVQPKNPAVEVTPQSKPQISKPEPTPKVQSISPPVTEVKTSPSPVRRNEKPDPIVPSPPKEPAVPPAVPAQAPTFPMPEFYSAHPIEATYLAKRVTPGHAVAGSNVTAASPVPQRSMPGTAPQFPIFLPVTTATQPPASKAKSKSKPNVKKAPPPQQKMQQKPAAKPKQEKSPNKQKKSRIPPKKVDLVIQCDQDMIDATMMPVKPTDMNVDLSMFDPKDPAERSRNSTFDMDDFETPDMPEEAEARVAALFDDIFNNEKYTGGLALTSDSEDGLDSPTRKSGGYGHNWDAMGPHSSRAANY